MHRTSALPVAALALASLTGCASTYSNLVSGSNLGAQEYQPAVLVTPGHEGYYQQALGTCRQVAVNRQITSAQQAQLGTITSSVSGATAGASVGWQTGALLKSGGWNTSINKSIGVGAATGLLGSLGGAFASGTERSQSETRDTLLTCLRAADPGQQKFRVVE